MGELKPSILALTETWLVYDYKITSKPLGYTYVISDRNRCSNRSGVLPYTKDSLDIHFFVCESHEGGNYKVTSCGITFKTVHLLSTYQCIHSPLPVNFPAVGFDFSQVHLLI